MADHSPRGGRYYTELPEKESLNDEDELFALDGGYGQRVKMKQLKDMVTDIIANPFTEANPYYEGEYCIYDGNLYKFTEDKEPGDWDGNIVERTTVGKELTR